MAHDTAESCWRQHLPVSNKWGLHPKPPRLLLMDFSIPCCYGSLHCCLLTKALSDRKAWFGKHWFAFSKLVPLMCRGSNSLQEVPIAKAYRVSASPRSAPNHRIQELAYLPSCQRPGPCRVRAHTGTTMFLRLAVESTGLECALGSTGILTPAVQSAVQECLEVCADGETAGGPGLFSRQHCLRALVLSSSSRSLSSAPSVGEDAQDEGISQSLTPASW